MYASNPNQQAMESRNRIRNALLKLMEQYPVDEITITQICQEAQVVRQTYYRNFKTKDDILAFHLNEIMECYHTQYAASEGNFDVQFHHFFSFIASHKSFLLLLHKNDRMHLLNQTVTRYIDSFVKEVFVKSEILAEYGKEYVASTLCSMLTVWIRNDFLQTSDELACIAERFFLGLR